MNMKKAMEFLSWFWHDLLDYFGSRHRVHVAVGAAAGMPTADGRIAAGRWQPVRNHGKHILGDLGRALGHMNRRFVEVCVVALVLLPIMGYYFSIAVPAVMKFWLARLG